MNSSARENRRVSVRDLLEAGLISVGDRLRFTRPRSGQEHIATVSAEGRIVLSNGAEYDTPSDAARAVAKIQVNGWTVWQTDTNRTLASLRAQLRDATSGVETLQSSHEYLREMGEQLRSGEVVSVTVRELLRQWGARNRGTRVTHRIENDLADHGLTTFPNFRDVALDTVVRFSMLDDEPTAQTVGDSKLSLNTLDDSDSGGNKRDPRQIGIRVGNLPSAMSGITFVNPDSTVEQAVTLMQIDDYSQLPVMSANKRKLAGAVSWKTIAIARNKSPHATLGDCTIKAPEISYNRELVDILADLQSTGFVFVRNEVNEINGIVTDADLARAYGDTATPYSLIGELDQLLRHIIGKHVSLADAATLCDTSGSREIKSFDEFSMGDYERVLQNREVWSRLNTKLDRTAFCVRLSTIREIRNDMMHFNPDDIPENTVDILRNFLRMIRLNLAI